MKNESDMTIDFDDNNEVGLFDKQVEQAVRDTNDELFDLETRSLSFLSTKEKMPISHPSPNHFASNTLSTEIFPA